MEVASFQSPFNPHSNLDTMDSAMDMDMDIDLGPLPDDVEAIDVVCTSYTCIHHTVSNPARNLMRQPSQRRLIVLPSPQMTLFNPRKFMYEGSMT
jgi:hypothetical protein